MRVVRVIIWYGHCHMLWTSRGEGDLPDGYHNHCWRLNSFSPALRCAFNDEQRHLQTNPCIQRLHSKCQLVGLPTHPTIPRANFSLLPHASSTNTHNDIPHDLSPLGIARRSDAIFRLRPRGGGAFFGIYRHDGGGTS